MSRLVASKYSGHRMLKESRAGKGKRIRHDTTAKGQGRAFSAHFWVEESSWLEE